jgi:hypothetical protein
MVTKEHLLDFEIGKGNACGGTRLNRQLFHGTHDSSRRLRIGRLANASQSPCIERLVDAKHQDEG